MFNIVLVQPEIPPNTGNVIRLAANTGCSAAPDRAARLLDGRQAAAPRRARLPRVRRGAAPCARGTPSSPARSRRPVAPASPSRRAAAGRFAEVAWQARRLAGVRLARRAGLPPPMRDGFPPAQRVRLPMRAGQRSLNLSNAVAVAVFEAWRQNGYAGARLTPSPARSAFGARVAAHQRARAPRPACSAPSSTAATASVIGISTPQRARALQHRRRAVHAFGDVAELGRGSAAAPGPAPAAGRPGGCATGRRSRSAPGRRGRTGP